MAPPSLSSSSSSSYYTPPSSTSASPLFLDDDTTGGISDGSDSGTGGDDAANDVIISNNNSDHSKTNNNGKNGIVTGNDGDDNINDSNSNNNKDNNNINKLSSDNSISLTSFVSVIQRRTGTISSARFNILSTMVGGGSLSLPLAYQQAGPGLLAPLLSIGIAIVVDKTVHFLLQAGLRSTISSTQHQHQQSLSQQQQQPLTSLKHLPIGTASFESMSLQAFGKRAKHFTAFLVFIICWLSVVAYAVLLRDMLRPLADNKYFHSNNSSGNNDGGIISNSTSSDGGGAVEEEDDPNRPTLARNMIMLSTVLLSTPLNTMIDLTPLRNAGAASMCAILILASCITYRSYQCNFSNEDPWLTKRSTAGNNLRDLFHLGPIDISSFLDALPVLIGVYTCHFNVLAIHNNLYDPTPQRSKKVFAGSFVLASLLYVWIGLAGAAYGRCVAVVVEDGDKIDGDNDGPGFGYVAGNVLLSFDEDDKLLAVGRACLALTLVAAFPVFVVPARDILLRYYASFRAGSGGYGDTVLNTDCRSINDNDSGSENDEFGGLDEPLLNSGDDGDNDDDLSYDDHYNYDDNSDEYNEGPQSRTKRSSSSPSTALRIFFSLAVLWSGALAGCFVEDIDLVWDFLGSTISIIIGFVIPCGSYLALTSSSTTTPTVIPTNTHIVATTSTTERGNGESAVDTEMVPPGAVRTARWGRTEAWIILLVIMPVMIACTTRVVQKNFFPTME